MPNVGIDVLRSSVVFPINVWNIKTETNIFLFHILDVFRKCYTQTWSIRLNML